MAPLLLSWLVACADEPQRAPTTTDTCDYVCHSALTATFADGR